MLEFKFINMTKFDLRPSMNQIIILTHYRTVCMFDTVDTCKNLICILWSYVLDGGTRGGFLLHVF